MTDESGTTHHIDSGGNHIPEPDPSGANGHELSGTRCVRRPDFDVTESTLPAASAKELIDGEELTGGDFVADYCIREMIGRGGCGTVYSAEHRVHRTEVAIKVLRLSLASSPQQVRRFLREARALQLIDHAGIVKILDDGYLGDGRPYFVMELLEGVSLATLIAERGRFSPAEALELLEPICEPLALAHEAGIIHRDIKASNIMIGSPAAGRQVKLLDFGLAKLVKEEPGASVLTSMNCVLGTLHSMAPEQILGGTVDARTDVYALGALLHRMLTGRHPFEDVDGQKIVRMHLQAPPPQPSQLAPVPPALDAVVRRSMDKDPNRRYESVTMFLDALREAASGNSEHSRVHGAALGVFIEGRIKPEVAHEGALDEYLFADLMAILDAAERTLQAAGFQVLLETTTALLAARAITTGHAGDDADPARDFEPVRATLAELHATLRQRAEPDSRIHINICVHRDRAVMRHRGGKVKITGGSIADVSLWAPRHDIYGICATREAVGALEHEHPYIPVDPGNAA